MKGRNVPWHIYNIEAVDTAKQAFAGMDGLTEMVEIKRHEGELAEKVRELKEKGHPIHGGNPRSRRIL